MYRVLWCEIPTVQREFLVLDPSDVLAVCFEQVIRGQNKGLMGQVVEATDTHVKVELHSKLKKVTVPRNQVKQTSPIQYGM